ncbi:adenosylmethionine--8-amino-7-oxononanoate transaminase [Parathermosynechococcus lividus PCC 6715]|jgi:adenosylmethionine-8-amino-7-oxononanoate aminotransferase|uniref:Adenosylmethionine-8-amino-7-oxononanoate aminotransferase n=1 Tax=Parathermosynechococcus lividus PCC 6715 TaxID=1917166 RepID=A0A2D2Q351_PARLV|nr:adenosylmethionine--8-amino-7-oxononanoate transaminase [Thermostichus lividus]ATS18687.1 adenosylmethionine--8-amino-7-oxononanoate transaminase [Thermostichus lividus PCC 6715]MCH9055186.1 adenosylmethionine--8-amino-7-oxononanoate transaminase [Synechococcus sp. PCC 6716]
MPHSPIWQPFTQMKTADPPLHVERAAGAILELKEGRQIIDAISSWWVTLHGHSHPVLAEALYHQAQTLEHVIFTGFSHEPAETLAHLLCEHTPAPLQRVFFSDNGSTAVEVALKMAYQYWQQVGQPQRSRLIGFAGGYHGDTLGAMTVGQSSPWWQPFQPLLPPLTVVPYPATYPDDPDVSAKEAAALAELQKTLDAAPNEYAALFIEPLVQGAAGMRMCRPEFLQAVSALAKAYGVLVVYDEVMTGFGRTGALFACEKAGTQPDVLCLSKGLSGGCLPLAVTLATEAIYQAFYDDDPARAFFHSHSYTGNPLACAVSVASLQLLLAQPHTYERLEALHWQCQQTYLADVPNLHQFRTCGTIAAMELVLDQQTSYFSALVPKLRRRFLELGVLLRPLGSTLYILPPYCITETQLAAVYGAIRQVAIEVAEGLFGQ